jgi:cobyric acid synthase CobQ/L-threonine-O-3-phosphate decarboxylase
MIMKKEMADSNTIAPIGKHEHGGNIYKIKRDNLSRRRDVMDFSANINPLGPPGWLRSHLNRNLELVGHYPDPECFELRRTISQTYQVSEKCIVPANGTTELLHFLPYILDKREVIVPVPSYIDYITVFQKNGFQVKTLVLSEEDGYQITAEILEPHIHGNEIVIFGNPANPSGTFLADHQISQLARRHQDTLFIIDEAFHEFVSPFNTVGETADNIITLNSLTKFYATPGLRIGFGLLPADYAKKIKTILPQWSVNTLAQSSAVKFLVDNDYCEASRLACTQLRENLKDELDALTRLVVFPSQANYFLVKLQGGMSADTLYSKLLKSHIIIRRCGNYLGLDNSYFRVAVRTERENSLLVHALTRALGSQRKTITKSARLAQPLMFQGTSSNAGKSILSAAFCRILLQDGFNVAPFKAQNMSLNSHVTHTGGEMGRAQVVQAMAAKVDPDCRMNPILLKPNSHTGSQVIVNGKPVANMEVKQYHQYKERAWEAVQKSYDQLSAEFDIIVLEGAGSPGEINLKRHDIVNMKMARYASAPVLIVGDIDRGGVYASMAGIMDVLEEWERTLIAGFVVNKFRGDESLLKEAHQFIFEHTGREVFAVVPYVTDISIPEEDSVSLREGRYDSGTKTPDQVDIVVIDLPHISNFTDIDPLYHEPDVNIRFVKNGIDLGEPDAVIIPGSKNVGGDLKTIKERGFFEALSRLADQGCVIVGICGGYQMLGRKMSDPHKIETDNESMQGIGLLDIETVLHPEKTLRKREGTHIRSDLTIFGYEIHHGITDAWLNPVLRFKNGETCGSQSLNGSIWGAYLHGIFDDDLFRRWFIDDLRQRKNLPKKAQVLAPYDLEKSLDELADVVRSCFDMKRIYRLLNL